MSWGANARRLTDFYGNGKTLVLTSLSEDDPALPAFKEAAERLLAQGVFGVDGSLETGGLCSRAGARAIQAATGIVPYGYEWTAEEVKDVASRANWSVAPISGEEGAMLSAKAFFDVCVAQDLGMAFD